jgi:hypothetical protein
MSQVIFEKHLTLRANGTLDGDSLLVQQESLALLCRKARRHFGDAGKRDLRFVRLTQGPC